jgi:hypothetical protein
MAFTVPYNEEYSCNLINLISQRLSSSDTLPLGAGAPTYELEGVGITIYFTAICSSPPTPNLKLLSSFN